MIPTWRCYRSFRPIKAISFDLDDTLYDNVPVMHAAEAGVWHFLQQRLPEWQQYDRQQWQIHRHKLVRRFPFLQHDVSRLRRWAIREMAQALGANKREARRLSHAAFEHFLQLRNQVQVADQVHALLAALADRYPLVAISNGNVSLDAIGLSDYFDVALFAGDGWPMKPVHCLFREAERRLKLPATAFLHIGDNLHADVHGANMAGWQSGWFNPQRSEILYEPLASSLPNFEFYDLAALSRLL